MRLLFLCAILFSSIAQAELKHESEISTITSGGNSNIETYLFKTENDYVRDEKLNYKFGGHYTYGEANENVSARDWSLRLKAEQMITDYIALLLGQSAEGYLFQGINARYNSDIGAKYYYIKSDERNFFTELGYRYTIEDRINEKTQYENKARLYNEFNSKYSESMQYRLWAEYVPNFSDPNDYLFNFEASITSIISSIFSLKVAYRGTYDQVPALEGNKNYDYTYTTSLVAKF
jgi:putative salt-induced outer membrane protein